MLGRTEGESPAHAALAARTAGWSGVAEGSAVASAVPDESRELLDLGTTADTLATVASIADLAAVVHLGHPEQPSPVLEEALLAGASSLIVTAAVAVPSRWVWVGPPDAAGGQVVIDEAGMRDCRDALRTMGVSPRLVPTRTPLDERAAIAGPAGSLVVERDRVPAGWVELPGSERLGQHRPLWYGLLEARDAWPRFDDPAQVWLAFGPYDDHRGSLHPTLAVLSDAGIDLQHLRSHPSSLGPHVFFTSFRCPDVGVLDGLVAELDARRVAHRTLAVLPGDAFVPGPEPLVPGWARS
ncbi:hypothetical protein [Isoptericola variabilis]|uniref:Uncharacterized protein n=1 Tax=Isoptericola variabilis (strain 225) TaxID=743718 RepID=F6FPT1_ISOV2|nr:hypothetical protein [Isoptericola variabilis]AEG43720.1 hypothetical protein Isova_0936 [Isoptericola variabilis 225]TWH27400.1 hypothetical protein L600_000500000730 [Isoptericola variabilis J7]